jgi:hypothetical protein
LLEITTWRNEASVTPVPLSSPWTEYLELSVARYSDHLLLLLNSLGFRAPLEVVDVVEILITIASLLKTSTSSQDKTQNGTTLTTLLILLRKEYQTRADCMASNDACYQAIFILCGLLSIVYEPSTRGQARINTPDRLIAHQLVQPEVSLGAILDRPLGFILLSTYSLNTNIPLLADRLEIVRTYINNQKASKKGDMYRDRRNSGEWLA